MAEKVRDPRLDVLKAVAMALVVLGHVIRVVYDRPTDAPVLLAGTFSLLTILHVPLFVFVSGYLAKPAPGASWLGRRALQLMVPYVAWQMVRWLAYYRTDVIGWLGTILIWRDSAVPTWFLYGLFLVSVVYTLVGRRRWLMIAFAVACVLVPPALAPYFSLRYVMLLFPLFVAGRLAGERRFEPGPWILPLAAVMLLALWAGPGRNLLFSNPVWVSWLPRSAATSLIVPVGVSILRTGCALALSAATFFVARRATWGAWIGTLTLGIYCSHPLFTPQWTRGDGLWGVIVAFTIMMVGATGTAMLLRRSRWTAFLFMGCGDLPWRPARAVGPAVETVAADGPQP